MWVVHLLIPCPQFTFRQWVEEGIVYPPIGDPGNPWARLFQRYQARVRFSGLREYDFLTLMCSLEQLVTLCLLPLPISPWLNLMK